VNFLNPCLFNAPVDLNEKSFSTFLAVLIQYTSVIDKRTDGHTTMRIDNAVVVKLLEHLI